MTMSGGRDDGRGDMMMVSEGRGDEQGVMMTTSTIVTTDK
jgi:hypothetical protein